MLMFCIADVININPKVEGEEVKTKISQYDVETWPLFLK